MYSASVFSHAQKHTHTAKRPYSTTRQHLAFIYPDDIGSLQHFSTCGACCGGLLFPARARRFLNEILIEHTLPVF